MKYWFVAAPSGIISVDNVGNGSIETAGEAFSASSADHSTPDAAQALDNVMGQRNRRGTGAVNIELTTRGKPCYFEAGADMKRSGAATGSNIEVTTTGVKHCYFEAEAGIPNDSWNDWTFINWQEIQNTEAKTLPATRWPLE